MPMIRPAPIRPVLALLAGTTIAFFLSAAPAQAYVGPGLGLGAVSTAFGVLGAIVLGLVAFVWYPVKRLIRMVRGRGRKRAGADAGVSRGEARL